MARGCTILCLASLLSCSPDGASRSAITRAMPDEAHPQVIAIVTAEGELRCSGTLIAPHTVLTAAHCIDERLSRERARVVFGSSAQAPGAASAEISHAEAHPGFVPSTFANDIGLLTLRQTGAATPLALDSRTLDASLVGQSFAAVGFGASGGTSADAGIKRAGTGQVSAISDGEFTNTPASAHACEFDSGGPALFTIGGTQVVSGVASHGDNACADHSVYARVDLARPTFIQPYLAKTGNGTAAVGERCFHEDQCRGGPCLITADDPALSFCSQPCADAGQCPAGMECASDGCRHPVPSPGALGAACTSDAQCADRLCHDASSGGGVCTRRCVAVGNSCPSGFVCQNSGGGISFHCLREPGGCAMSGRPGGVHGLCWLLALCVLVWRRSCRLSVVASSRSGSCSRSRAR
jgi:hypothetical protein